MEMNKSFVKEHAHQENLQTDQNLDIVMKPSNAIVVYMDFLVS